MLGVAGDSFCSSIRRAACPTSRSLHELSDGGNGPLKRGRGEVHLEAWTLIGRLERKQTLGDKALVSNTGYRRFLADPPATDSPSMQPKSTPMPVSMAS
jgi:hypothetical protein